MDISSRKLDRILAESKLKLITLQREQEILQQIQQNDYSKLQILIESYSHSVFKAMQQSQLPLMK